MHTVHVHVRAYCHTCIVHGHIRMRVCGNVCNIRICLIYVHACVWICVYYHNMCMHVCGDGVDKDARVSQLQRDIDINLKYYK